MNIDELKETRDTFAVWGYETLLSDELIEKIISILDAEIARQSVKSEEVAEAIGQVESLIKAIGNDMHWRSDKLMDSLDLAITALQQMRTEGCHCCNGIENHGIKFVKTVTDKLGRSVDAYNTPYNFCPNCGRKVR